MKYVFLAYIVKSPENEPCSIFNSLSIAMDKMKDTSYFLIAMELNKVYPDDPSISLNPEEYQNELVWFPKSEEPHGVFTELMKEIK